MNKCAVIILLTLNTYTLHALGPTCIQTARPLNASHFLQKVTLTEKGLEHFYTCYNNQLYIQRFLPNCFLHIDDLLSYAKKMEDPHVYVQKVFSLFHERFKGCPSDNPYALAQLLTLIPERISFLFNPDERTLEGQDLYNLIRFHVEQNITQLNVSLSDFTNTLTTDLFALVKTDRSRHLTSAIITRFLESTLDKIVWSPEDKYDVWKSFKTIGNQLEVFLGKAIIQDLDTLNSLLWSLVYRFCYFIELWGSAIPDNAYDKMIADAPTIHFLQILEQEEQVTPKLEILMRALKTGKTKAVAYKRGILS